ncbi:MAG: hypothetical protein ACWA5X_10185 [bacterium]
MKLVSGLGTGFCVLLGLSLLGGCDSGNRHEKETAAAADKTEAVATGDVDAQVFIYQEWEKGIDPYKSRVIVTRDYLRLDDGRADGDYLLFNRDTKVISSLTQEDRTILRMKRKPVTLEPGDASAFSVKERDASDMPKMAGHQPLHRTLFSGDKECYNVVAVPGMAPDAVAAMKEYLLTLAGEQAENLYKTPEEFRDPCMMSNLIYKPVAHLDFGFPLREWDYKGYGRELVGMQEQKLPSSLFQLNPDYHVYQLSDTGIPAKVQ